MTRRVTIIAFALLLLTVLPSPESRAAGGTDSRYSFHAFLGEALMPSNFRLGLKSFDLGFDGRNGLLYAGGKTFQGRVYAGFGGAFGAGVGLYGLLGVQFLPFTHVGINMEFFASGTTNGTLSSTGLLGVGVIL